MTRVAFVVNGSPASAMGERAAAFAVRLADRFDVALVHRVGGKGRAAVAMVRRLLALRPAACYVFDLAADGVAAAVAVRVVTGTPFVLDTGDDVVALGRAVGRGHAGMVATRTLDAVALRAASAVVARGEEHVTVLAKRGIRATFVPDGVSVDSFRTNDHPPPSPLTIGLVGSVTWNPVTRSCYGAELVELVRLLRDDFPVRGVLIGDGTGLPFLRERCREHSIEPLVTFAGRVPYPDLPAHLSHWHIALSTQTDDAVGRVRTTGKLPLYLAAGRFVLASRVGQAARVLPAEMLVEYRGSHDPDYPRRLADHIRHLVAAGTAFAPRPECVVLARQHFEYDRLADRVADVLNRVVRR